MPLWKQKLSLSSTALLDKVPIEEKPKERAVTHPERSATSSVLLFFLFTMSMCFMCEDISGFNSEYLGLYSVYVLGHL